MSLWVNAAAESVLATGVGYSAIRHRGGRHYQIVCAVAGVKVNGVAAADFQHSSLFAVAGRTLWSSTPLVLIANLSNESQPRCQAHGI